MSEESRSMWKQIGRLLNALSALAGMILSIYGLFAQDVYLMVFGLTAYVWATSKLEET